MSLSDKLRGAVSYKKWVRRPEVLTSACTVQPMHGVVPRLILGRTWWDATRDAAYRSTGFHCIACGVYKYEAKEKQWLEGHEVYEIDYLLGRQTYLETVPLCHYCHNFIHERRLFHTVTIGDTTQEKYNAIMAHGFAVLNAAGLKRKTFQGPMAGWGSWRLILFGKEYKPKFKTYEEWVKHFRPGGDDE